jgi:hypothetical protein
VEGGTVMDWSNVTIEPDAIPVLREWIAAADTIIMPAELWQKLASELKITFDKDGNIIEEYEVLP